MAIKVNSFDEPMLYYYDGWLFDLDWLLVFGRKVLEIVEKHRD